MGTGPVRWRISRSVLVIALLATGCNTSPTPSEAGLTRGTLTVATADGTRAFDVEIAETDATRQRGLMGRSSVPPGTGMVFLFDAPTDGAFWMKDTLIPLTIVFWDADGEVVDVLEMLPCEADPCPYYRPDERYVGALEVARGEADGITDGDDVALDR